MSFDWKDYVCLAEELLNRDEESCLRSAISRAYYGTFCVARNRKGYQSYKGGDVHLKVINAYKFSANGNDRDIGRLLDKLRRSRNEADYNENKRINKNISQRMIFAAKQILTIMRIP